MAGLARRRDARANRRKMKRMLISTRRTNRCKQTNTRAECKRKMNARSKLDDNIVQHAIVSTRRLQYDWGRVDDAQANSCTVISTERG
uniref:Uncharacterized protein n=1 Tax=Romanomermis culicivorax TaxID=13658 RepID=A0A915JLH7_ROMCU